MPPVSSREFQGAAAERLVSARVLLRENRNLDAQYLGGYTFECSLKALILEVTPDTLKPEALIRISAGAKMHRPSVLFNELRKFEVTVPDEITRRMRRFVRATDLRYESNRRDSGETKAFLITAQAVYDWVEARLP